MQQLLIQMDNQIEGLDDVLDEQPKAKYSSLNLKSATRSKQSKLLPNVNRDQAQSSVLKKLVGHKLTDDERKQLALTEIYQFYSKQHIKRGIEFDQISDQTKMEKGELVNFCRDFKIQIPKTKILQVFVAVSKNGAPLAFE